MTTLQQIRFIWKPIVFLLCLAPATLVVTDAFELTGNLGANPVEEILDRFGNWGLRFIMITLAITPLRRISGWNWLSQFRRMIGLFTFFYVLMHFTTWFVLDRDMMLSEVVADLAKRPFILIGFAALLLLTALAVTSFTAIRRRMGRRWQTLHNAVYIVGMLGVWHYWWQVKLDFREPLTYALILATLLGARVIWRVAHSRRQRQSARPMQEQS